MKATLIISSEYRLNQPSVFALIDGNYYGCQIYPFSRNYPPNVDYWTDATCSDSDRFFHVKPVEYTEDQFKKIKDLQSAIFSLQKLLKNSPSWTPPCRYKIRRGKNYMIYKAAWDLFVTASKEIEDYNKPYDKAITSAFNELRSILCKN